MPLRFQSPEDYNWQVRKIAVVGPGIVGMPMASPFNYITAFAVLLGVAFMAGTLVFTDTVRATFDSALAEANAPRAELTAELSLAESKSARLAAEVPPREVPLLRPLHGQLVRVGR